MIRLELTKEQVRHLQTMAAYCEAHTPSADAERLEFYRDLLAALMRGEVVKK